jgi:1-acyl-sn-glycerol-3-phosphate acyltransferase
LPRRLLRLLRVGLHVAAGCALSAIALPLLGRRRRLALRRRWSRELLDVLGVRLDAHGVRIQEGSLVVANHVSWLDVLVIGALAPAAFVCKSEVRSWPVIGWLAMRHDAVFLRRGSGHAARRVNARIGRLLAAGETVVAFPEGTSSDGARVLPFRPALFEPAAAGGRAIQPLAILYCGPDGSRSEAAAFTGDTTLWSSLLQVAAAQRLVVRIRSCEPLAAAELGRRESALRARAAIQRLLFGGGSRPARLDLGTTPVGSHGSAPPEAQSSTAPSWDSQVAVSRA